MKQISIALLGDGFYTWSGGIDFLANIAADFHAFNDRNKVEKYKIWVVLPKENRIVRGLRRLVSTDKKSEKERFQKVFDAIKRVCPESRVVFYKKHIKRVYNDHGRNLENTLKKIGADICFPVLREAYPEINIPWMGYIADFQEKYLPSLFDKKTLSYREENSIMQAKNTKYFFVNSLAVKEDLKKYYPYGDYKVYSQPFAPVINLADLKENNQIPVLNNIEEKYFLISNQFWKHKSHDTAIKALWILQNRGYKDIHIYCTGNHEDYRNKTYYDELLLMLKELNLEKYIHFLGYVSKDEQTAIMRKSLALIQPTLFEGGPGGGAVYMAVSLGVPTIMSDIPANMEVGNREGVYYFKRKDEVDLADKMEQLLLEMPKKKDSQLLCRESEKNVKILNDFYDEMIEEVMKGYHARKFRV